MKSSTAMRLLFATTVLLCPYLCSPEAEAYRQFQEYSEKTSGQPTNCAMCHANGNGPEGNEHGQIGGLDEDGMKRLTSARAAMDPGVPVDSPILNEFGNKIVEKLGRKKLLSLIQSPDKLAEELGSEDDLDGDGIADSIEYMDGTDPTNEFHGSPWRLFQVNATRHRMHIILTGASVLFLVFGFSHLLRGITIISESRGQRD